MRGTNPARRIGVAGEVRYTGTPIGEVVAEHTLGALSLCTIHERATMGKRAAIQRYLLARLTLIVIIPTNLTFRAIKSSIAPNTMQLTF